MKTNHLGKAYKKHADRNRHRQNRLSTGCGCAVELGKREPPPNVHQANHYDLVMLYAMAADGLAKQNKPLTGASFREYLTTSVP